MRPVTLFTIFVMGTLALSEFFSAEFSALLQVLFIDVVLAGDNAVVVGMAAAGVDPAIRKKVIFWGIGGAVVLRILFALVAVQLLAIVGLTLAGGILLLWVCWKMFREIRESGGEQTEAQKIAAAGAQKKTFWQAMIQIIIADVSMSLDNVLAVAGAAGDHTAVLVLGLLISVVLMGAAATLIANVLHKFPFIAWIGLLVILFVAVRMIWHGFDDVACHVGVLADYCSHPLTVTDPAAAVAVPAQ